MGLLLYCQGVTTVANSEGGGGKFATVSHYECGDSPHLPLTAGDKGIKCHVTPARHAYLDCQGRGKKPIPRAPAPLAIGRRRLHSDRPCTPGRAQSALLAGLLEQRHSDSTVQSLSQQRPCRNQHLVAPAACRTWRLAAPDNLPGQVLSRGKHWATANYQAGP